MKKAKLNTKLHIHVKRERRKLANEFKAEVALESIKGKLRMVDLAEKYKVNPLQIKAKGFMYMTAFIDVFNRKIMSWGFSSSISKQWCMDVLESAIAENGVPKIINSDQGAQYTSRTWSNYLEGKGIKTSMDGKGRATDNIWIERFWKTIKYNHIHLNPCDTGLELFEGVQIYIEYYHQK